MSWFSTSRRPYPVAKIGARRRTCLFAFSFLPNNIFTGTVYLQSHLDRSFADYDGFLLADGHLQLACVYSNSDGLRIHGAGTAGLAP